MGKKSFAQRLKEQAHFRKLVESQGLKRIELSGANSNFSKARFVKTQLVKLPKRRHPKPNRFFNHKEFNLFDWALTNRRSKSIKRNLKRDPFIKWNIRRLKLKSGWAIYRRENKEEEPEDMVRNTWGTGLSDKNIPVSFTFYTFSPEDLDRSDLVKCEDKFIICIDRWMRRAYPKRNYRYATAEADGWIKTIVRSEENASVDYNKEFFGKWSFEIDQEEEEYGELEDIL